MGRTNAQLIRLQLLNAGATLTDVALAESGYNYYGGLRTDGSWIITRENVAETEYRYAVGNGITTDDYDTAWTDRDTQSYNKPNFYKNF